MPRKPKKEAMMEVTVRCPAETIVSGKTCSWRYSCVSQNLTEEQHQSALGTAGARNCADTGQLGNYWYTSMSSYRIALAFNTGSLYIPALGTPISAKLRFGIRVAKWVNGLIQWNPLSTVHCCLPQTDFICPTGTTDPNFALNRVYLRGQELWSAVFPVCTGNEPDYFYTVDVDPSQIGADRTIVGWWTEPFEYRKCSAFYVLHSPSQAWIDVTYMVPDLIVRTGLATDLFPDRASLRGELQAAGAGFPVDAWFQYGVVSGVYGNSSAKVSLSSLETFVALLTGLTPNRTYFYRAVADDHYQPVVYGGEESFATPPVVNALEVETLAASSITPSSAQLNGRIISTGAGPPVNCFFRWGTNPSDLVNTTPPTIATGVEPFSANLVGLTVGATYYFQAVAENASQSADGTILAVAIPAQKDLVVDTDPASLVGSSSARLHGRLVLEGAGFPVNVWFEYGVSSGLPTRTTPAVVKSSLGAFEASIGGLYPGTPYYFHAVADDGASPIAYGQEMSFTTLSGGEPADGDGSSVLWWLLGLCTVGIALVYRQRKKKER